MTILDTIRTYALSVLDAAPGEGAILIFVGVMALGAFICPDSSLDCECSSIASRWGSL